MIDDSMLDVMSLADLKNLAARISNKIARKQEDDRLEAIQQIHEIASGLGLSVEELLGLKKRRADAGQTRDSYNANVSRKGQKQKRKYRNPDDHSQTWAGGGNVPNWVKAGMERGMSLEDFLNPEA